MMNDYYEITFDGLYFQDVERCWDADVLGRPSNLEYISDLIAAENARLEEYGLRRP